VVVVLYGHQALALGRALGRVISWVLVAGGLIAAVVHTYFLLNGDEAFRLPVSSALLAATFAISLMQAKALLWARD
jgi:hypothetical protein